MDQIFVLGLVIALLLVLVLGLNIQVSSLNNKVNEIESREGSISEKIDELLKKK